MTHNSFSIVIPVYNDLDYLKICLDSCLKQDYTFYNIILVDSGSGKEIIEFYESILNPKIQIYKTDKRFLIEDNWARILDIEKNDYFTILGQDDLLNENYLLEMNELINKHPSATLYQTHFEFIDKDGLFIKSCKPMAKKEFGFQFLESQMRKSIDSTATGYMIRSIDYKKLGGISPNYPNLIYADFELWVKLSSLNYKATSAKSCFKYRIHNSVSKLTNGEAYSKAFEKYIHFIISLFGNEDVKKVVNNYGHKFLMDNCEGLSHRILKTRYEKRNIKAKYFIDNCEKLAKLFIPNIKFNARHKIKIIAAEILDSNIVSRNIFQFFRK